MRPPPETPNEEEKPMRDDIGGAPVVTAMLARDGLTVEGLDWRVDSIWAADGHEVVVANRESMDLKLHRDEEADWFATVHWGPHLTYHAQRGRRSLTLRRELPESVTSTLVGMHADAVADMPGLDGLLIVEVRTSTGTSTAVILKPIDPRT